MRRPEWWIVACLAMLCLILAREANAAIPEADMVRAVLGEAEGEPYEGKVALAYALINRGTLRGVYGYRAIKAQEGRYYRGTRLIGQKASGEALNAVKRAIRGGQSPVGKARHWENTKAYGVPYWAKGKTPICIISNHAFYDNID